MSNGHYHNAVDAKVKQWGGSLAIRLPKSIVDALDYQAEDTIHLQVVNQETLMVRKMDIWDERFQPVEPVNREIMDALSRFEAKMEDSIDHHESLLKKIQELTDKLFIPSYGGVASQAFLQLIDLAILNSNTDTYSLSVSGDKHWRMSFSGDTSQIVVLLQRPIRSGKESEVIGRFRLIRQPYSQIKIHYEPYRSLNNAHEQAIILKLTQMFLEDVTAEQLSYTVAQQVKKDFNL